MPVQCRTFCLHLAVFHIFMLRQLAALSNKQNYDWWIDIKPLCMCDSWKTRQNIDGEALTNCIVVMDFHKEVGSEILERKTMFRNCTDDVSSSVRQIKLVKLLICSKLQPVFQNNFQVVNAVGPGLSFICFCKCLILLGFCWFNLKRSITLTEHIQTQWQNCIFFFHLAVCSIAQVWKWL